jgi:hypothetical protein
MEEPELEIVFQKLEKKGFKFRDRLLFVRVSGRWMAKLYDPDGVCISLTKQVADLAFDGDINANLAVFKAPPCIPLSTTIVAFEIPLIILLR